MIARIALSLGLALCLAAAAGSCADAAEGPGRPRLCPEDAPEGVRLPPQPGCGSRETPVRQGETGFREILPGTGIRIGGRASSTFDARR